MRSTPLMIALALALGTGLASEAIHAQSMQEVKATAQASMVLSGRINIAADGSTESIELDKRDSIEPYLATFVEDAVKTWRFEPILVDGKAVRAHTQARVRLQARSNGQGGNVVSLEGADFNEYDEGATDSVTVLRLSPPRFPPGVFMTGGQGDVSLVIKVARDGTVADVIAEQVNLRVAARETEMRKMRAQLADASIKAAKRWRFRVPTTGENADEPFWSIRVPVSYEQGGQQRAYATWQAYIPGPRTTAPWLGEGAADTADPELMPAGGVYMVGVDKGPRLLTPLGG